MVGLPRYTDQNLLYQTMLVRLLFLLLLIPQSGFAHSPYFSETVSCHVPAGISLHILNGDGILGPDPKALVITNAEGRIVGYKTVSLKTVLLPATQCGAFDLSNKAIFTPDTSDPIPGAIIIGDSHAARETRWKFEPQFGARQTGFGILETAPNLPQRLDMLATIWLNPFPLACGALTGLGLGVLFMRRARAGISRLGPLPRVAFWLLALTLLTLLMVVTSLIFLFDPVLCYAAGFGFVLGCLAAILISWHMRARENSAPLA